MIQYNCYPITSFFTREATFHKSSKGDSFEDEAVARGSAFLLAALSSSSSNISSAPSKLPGILEACLGRGRCAGAPATGDTILIEGSGRGRGRAPVVEVSIGTVARLIVESVSGDVSWAVSIDTLPSDRPSFVSW